MAKKEDSKEDIGCKLDLVIKLLGVIATQEGLAKKTQQEQIVILYKMGFRNKDIADIFGIKPQQVNNAILRSKAKKK